MPLLLIISPAKRMDVVEGPPSACSRPEFLEPATQLAHGLLALGYDSARRVWRCSEAIARRSWAQLQTMPADMLADPALLSPAVTSYVGIQYQHLAPQVMTDRQIDWLRAHLRILSGLYGVLRPLDGVVPYRLEMQARLPMGASHDLYGFWGERIHDALARDAAGMPIVNVASHEYAKAVTPFARAAKTPVLTCEFLNPRKSDGRLVQAATEAKAARGTFVRWCAEQGVEETGELAGFRERGYRLDRSRSDEGRLTFVRDEP